MSNPVIVLGYNEFPCDGLDLFLSSVTRLQDRFKEQLQVYQLQFFGETVPTRDGITKLVSLGTRARDIIPGSRSKKPLVTEMFDSLAAFNSTGFVFTNCDIIISDEAIQWILDNTGTVDSACFSRVDIWPNMQRSDVSFSTRTPAGADMFYVNRQWWLANRQRFKDLPRVYAEPCWDNAFTTVLRRYGRCVFLNRNPMIYHVQHENRWSLSSVEGKWLDQCWEKSGIKMLWWTYMDHLRQRQYGADGRFAGDADKETKYEDNLFKKG